MRFFLDQKLYDGIPGLDVTVRMNPGFTGPRSLHREISGVFGTTGTHVPAKNPFGLPMATFSGLIVVGLSNRHGRRRRTSRFVTSPEFFRRRYEVKKTKVRNFGINPFGLANEASGRTGASYSVPPHRDGSNEPFGDVARIFGSPIEWTLQKQAKNRPRSTRNSEIQTFP